MDFIEQAQALVERKKIHQKREKINQRLDSFADNLALRSSQYRYDTSIPYNRDMEAVTFSRDLFNDLLIDGQSVEDSAEMIQDLLCVRNNTIVWTTTTLWTQRTLQDIFSISPISNNKR